MTKMDYSPAYKFNAIALAKHHKKHCEGSSCNISLLMLMQTCEDAGIKFTKKERGNFV